MPAGTRVFPKVVGTWTRSLCRPSSGMGGLCQNFESELLGHDHAASKGVGVQDGGRSGSDRSPDPRASNY